MSEWYHWASQACLAGTALLPGRDVNSVLAGRMINCPSRWASTGTHRRKSTTRSSRSRSMSGGALHVLRHGSLPLTHRQFTACVSRPTRLAAPAEGNCWCHIRAGLIYKERIPRGPRCFCCVTSPCFGAWWQKPNNDVPCCLRSDLEMVPQVEA